MARKEPHPNSLAEFPHDLDAERALLGSLLMHPERFVEVVDEVLPEDFYRLSHRLVFEAMARLFARELAADVVAVRAELERAGHMEEVGGIGYVSAMTDGVPRSSLEPAVAVVRDRALRRSLIAAGSDMLAAARGAESGAAALEEAEGAVYTLASKVIGGSDIVDSKQLAAEVLHVLDRLQTTGEVSGIETGLHELDNWTRGLHPSQLVILAARPGKGKSALALNIADHVSTTVPGVVPFFSLEMAREELGLRRVSTRSRISNHKVLSGILSAEDYRRLTHAAGEIAESRMLIDDSPERTVSQMRSICRRLKAQHGAVSMVVVDYLQLIAPAKDTARNASRQEIVANFSRGLKRLAKELRVPVLALSQLSRSIDERKNRRPQLSDLRESGALEQDADMVLFIHSPDTGKGWARIIVAKQRNGPTGSCLVSYDPSTFRFGNLERGAEPPPSDDDDGSAE